MPPNDLDTKNHDMYDSGLQDHGKINFKEQEQNRKSSNVGLNMKYQLSSLMVDNYLKHSLTTRGFLFPTF